MVLRAVRRILPLVAVVVVVLFIMQCLRGIPPHTKKLLKDTSAMVQEQVHYGEVHNKLRRQEDYPFQSGIQTFSTSNDPQLPIASGNSSDSPHVLHSTVPLRQALHQCSRAMGVTETSMLQNHDTFLEVVNRVESFLKEIGTLLPKNFSTLYRNPCWQAEQPKDNFNGWEEMLMAKFHPELAKPPPAKGSSYTKFLTKPANKLTKEKQLLCLPFFFLAGFPKSGTTTIHNFLTVHWQIEAPSEKEPHWWTRVLALGQSKHFNTKYIPISLIVYTLFFKGIRMRLEKNNDPLHHLLITYDASQSTLWDSNFYVNGQDYCAMPAVVSRVLPNAKFIVVMRNPASRLYSHFLYSCQIRYGKSIQKWPSTIKRGTAELFHNKLTKDIEQFNECLKNASVFECSSMRTANINGPDEELSDASCSLIWHRLTIGLYAVHIKKWLQFYPVQNFLFIRMEDFIKDSYATVSSITDFLDIEAVPKTFAENLLKKRENTHPEHVQPIELQSMELLENFYHPYNEELAELLHDDRFLWKDQHDHYTH